MQLEKGKHCTCWNVTTDGFKSQPFKLTIVHRAQKFYSVSWREKKEGSVSCCAGWGDCSNRISAGVPHVLAHHPFISHH